MINLPIMIPLDCDTSCSHQPKCKRLDGLMVNLMGRDRRDV